MKEHGNPALLSKVRDYFSVKEKGSNYPPDLFDPNAYDPADFYDAIALASRNARAKQQETPQPAGQQRPCAAGADTVIDGDAALATARATAELITQRLMEKRPH